MARPFRCWIAVLAALLAIALTPAGAGATFPGDNGRIAFNRGTFSNETGSAEDSPESTSREAQP